MAELFAFFVHDQTTSGEEFGANKPDESAQDAKDNDQNAQNADSETGMMKIVHLDFLLSRGLVEILTQCDACHFIWHYGCYYGIISGMKNLIVQMDQAGRVVLPKPLRERFRLHGGDSLTLEIKGDAIELRPQKANLRLERVNGVLVLSNEMSLRGDLVSESRNERIDEIARKASDSE